MVCLKVEELDGLLTNLFEEHRHFPLLCLSRAAHQQSSLATTIGKKKISSILSEDSSALTALNFTQAICVASLTLTQNQRLAERKLLLSYFFVKVELVILETFFSSDNCLFSS